MGLWGSIKKAAKKAVKAVASAVSTAAEAVADAAATVVEAVGGAIDDGLNALANAAQAIPGIGGALAGGLRWAAGVAASASDLAASTIRATGGLVAGVAGGLIQVVGGILTLDPGLIKEGALDIAGGIGGFVLLAGGKLVEFVQSALLIQAPKRRLTAAETAMLRRVFWESVAVEKVRLVEGRAGLFGLNARPFTLGYTIYLKERDVSQEPALLVHECTHVWQYEHVGASYTAEAVGAQWFVDDEYSWEKEIGRNNTEWVSFNREAQASFLEDIYVHGKLIVLRVDDKRGYLLTGSVEQQGGGVFYDADGQSKLGLFEFNGVDHTERANRAVAVVRHAGGLAGILLGAL